MLAWNEELAELAKTANRQPTYTFDRLCEACDKDGDRRISEPEWNTGKPGWEWLFPIIDRNRDAAIDAREYAGFQEFKRAHPDWQQQRPKVSN